MWNPARAFEYLTHILVRIDPALKIAKGIFIPRFSYGPCRIQSRLRIGKHKHIAHLAVPKLNSHVDRYFTCLALTGGSPESWMYGYNFGIPS